jgi:hypothetical protein
MITAAIAAGRRESLARLLATMNQAPGLADPRNELVPFWQLRQLHVARFTILEAHTNDDIRGHGVEPEPWPPTLCFIGDVDGDAELFLAELVIRAEPGLRLIFAHCQGFDEDQSDLLQWMCHNSHKPDANYVNWRGRTVEQIREEQALADLLSAEWRRAGCDYPDLPPREAWHRLRQLALQQVEDGALSLTPRARTPFPWLLRECLHLVLVPALLLAAAPLALLLSPFYFLRLRSQERSDPENTRRADPDHLASLVEQEDIDSTNHFNVFGQVKPGLLRLLTIKFGLLLLDYSSRHIYRRGYLTRVQTIHFARWVLMDDNRRVYFASNYDGSADSYMDDFINKVAWGLNLVFSNGVGYPRTRWLIKGGAEYEEKYKRTLRRNQLPSESWYKAYPGMTAVDLARHGRIRKTLESKNPPEREIREWLTLL